jgi:hypothetical protein
VRIEKHRFRFLYGLFETTMEFEKMGLAKEISTGDLAALLGISTRNVGLLTEKKVFQKLKHGTYNLRDAVRSYVLHRESVVVEKHAVGEQGQLQIDTLREKLKLLRIDVEEREGSLVSERWYVVRPATHCLPCPLK